MSVDYVLRRLGLLVAVIAVAVTLNFFIPRLSGRNPIESRLYEAAAQGGVNVGRINEMIAEYEAKFGLDKPLWKQYLVYWTDILRGDLGVSIQELGTPVTTVIARRLPWTVGLLLTATVIAFAVGSLFGALMSWRKSPRAFTALVPLLMTLSAIPFYLLGIVLIFGFAMIWRFFPAGGAYKFGLELGLNWETVWSIFRHAVLPASAIVLGGIGFWGLGMRGMMITTMGEDYMKLADYKGLKERRIFLNYGIRNAILPQITAFAIVLAHVVSGAVLVEVVFTYPGIGHQLYRSIVTNDYFMMQGIILLVILSVAVGLLILDMIYPLLD
ncbi:MAG: ABC transporter permease, partial [Chloroflexi bacterium]|nr:ABC transporter permease [Chloroflexota bacterium]